MITSWKTTLAGIIAGLPVALDAIITAYNAGTFTGKSGSELALGIGAVLIGAFAKDHDVTGGTKANKAVTNPSSSVVTK
jgi:hypothetical protein